MKKKFEFFTKALIFSWSLWKLCLMNWKIVLC